MSKTQKCAECGSCNWGVTKAAAVCRHKGCGARIAFTTRSGFKLSPSIATVYPLGGKKKKRFLELTAICVRMLCFRITASVGVQKRADSAKGGCWCDAKDPRRTDGYDGPGFLYAVGGLTSDWARNIVQPFDREHKQDILDRTILDKFANEAVRLAFESLPDKTQVYCWAAVADYEKTWGDKGRESGWVKRYLIPGTPFTTWEFVLGSIFQWHVDFKDDIYSIVVGVRGSATLKIAGYEAMEDFEKMEPDWRKEGLADPVPARCIDFGPADVIGGTYSFRRKHAVQSRE